MRVHVVQRRIFDIHGDVVACFHLGACGFDPAGQFCNLGLRRRNLGLRYFNLTCKICHHTPLLIVLLLTHVGNVMHVYIRRH